ncbi:MAG: GNAT family N-acetyltransferase [Anaerolineales bacterium]
MTVRAALRSDRSAIASLLYFERYVHRHLDWRSPLDWLEYEPFVLYEDQGRIIAALACPDDPPEVAWIRLFAVSTNGNFQQVWQPLWELAYQILENKNHHPRFASIPLAQWFRGLIENSGFQQTNEVIILKWRATDYKWIIPRNAMIKLRPMQMEDLEEVARVDQSAFPVPWQVSLNGIAAGFNQAALAMVAESATGIVGYQLCTASTNGAHLARLAVTPEWQNQGVGSLLVNDLQRQFYEQGYEIVTVNTQADNSASLFLYKKMGFQLTGETYPLYEFP